MARNLTASMITAVTAASVRPILIARIGTATASPGGDVRVWSGVGDLSWDSGEGYGAQVFTGIGNFGGVSPVQETADLQAAGVNFTLSGVPSAMLATILGQIRYGRPARLWFGAFDTTTGALITSPYPMFSGRTDVPTIDEGAETSVIQLSAESALIDLDRPRVRRYTPEDQHLDDAADQGFDYVASLQDAQIVWTGPVNA